ncbi:hypothetical protein C0993_005414 [Termitomyces sp. T159_Od127]|nr:hypothetical protein C0993_005414 [Termitomyces sp. T159_Od127]
MSFCPKDHYKPHPYLAICLDGFFQLTSIKPNLIIHPAQLLKYLDHDEAVRNHLTSSDSLVPVSYKEWAAAYNSSKGDNPTKFTTFDLVTGLYNCDSFSSPRDILTIPYFDNCYSELYTFSIINNKGDLIDRGWANVKNVLLRPHHDAVRNQAHSDACKAKQALRKLASPTTLSRGGFAIANRLSPRWKPREHIIHTEREVFGRLTQCRTRHAFIGEYYAKFVPEESTRCTCKARYQTREHVLKECPNYDDHRHILKEADEQMELGILLGTKEGIEATAKFLAKSGAFMKTGKKRVQKPKPSESDEENDEEEGSWWTRMEGDLEADYGLVEGEG